MMFWRDDYELGRVDRQFAEHRVRFFSGLTDHPRSTYQSSKRALTFPVVFGCTYRGRWIAALHCPLPNLADLVESVTSVEEWRHAQIPSKKTGWTIFGIDPAPLMRTRASTYGQIFTGIAELLPAKLSTARFDAVIVPRVLEHCTAPAPAIKNAYSLLDPIGRLVVVGKQ